MEGSCWWTRVADRQEKLMVRGSWWTGVTSPLAYLCNPGCWEPSPGAVSHRTSGQKFRSSEPGQEVWPGGEEHLRALPGRRHWAGLPKVLMSRLYGDEASESAWKGRRLSSLLLSSCPGVPRPGIPRWGILQRGKAVDDYRRPCRIDLSWFS